MVFYFQTIADYDCFALSSETVSFACNVLSLSKPNMFNSVNVL